MVANTELKAVAPHLQARIDAWEKRAESRRRRVSALLNRQSTNLAQSTRQQLFIQRLQQQVNTRRAWTDAVRRHLEEFHAILTGGPGEASPPSVPPAFARRKTASAGE
jgi:hypothetical protein